MTRSGARYTRVHWLTLACFAVFGASVCAASTYGAPADAATASSAAAHLAATPAVAAGRADLDAVAAHRAAGQSGSDRPAAVGGFDCRTLTHCVALGANTPAMGTRLAGEGWNGTTWWRTAAVPEPTGTGGVGAGGVACPASHQCVAVGVGYPRTGPGSFAIAAYWHGGHWTTVRAAAAGSSSLLAAVSCPLPTSCYAVGDYTPKGSLAFAPLIEHWNGRNWSQLTAPVPEGSRYGNLSGVSCPATGFCVAVGTDGAGALIERWNDETWTATMPSATVAEMLYGVSCPSTTSCFAVGSNGEGNSSAVQRWDGHGWKESAAPVPRGSEFPWLQSVSCPSPTWCLAVGNDINPGAYAVAWNGHDWKLVPMTGNGGHVGYLQQVRCLTRTSCVALGATTQLAATQHSESAFWNGRTWKVIPTA